MAVVDELEEGLDGGALGNLLLAHALGHLRRGEEREKRRKEGREMRTWAGLGGTMLWSRKYHIGP